MTEKWRLCADTGGTFTDCIGWSPDGEEHRVKVLSSGCLRGVLAVSGLGPRLEVRCEWSVPPGFCIGFDCLVNGTPVGRIVDDAIAEGWIEVEAALDEAVPEGALVELRSPYEAPVLAARFMTGTVSRNPLPPMDFRLATTRGTNALLESKGAKVAFFVSEGFADLCRIGDQKRPDLFALKIEKPPPGHHAVVEISGRLDAQGIEIEPLDVSRLAEDAARVLATGCTVAAVALINSHASPDHERRVVERLRELGFDYVVGSAELRPFIHYLRRAETALVDATLGPIMESYLDSVESQLGGAASRGPSETVPPSEDASLRVMTSGGGLLSRNRFRAIDSLLSGPAAGVGGAASVGRKAGMARLIAFDMGGTSTDVSRWDGDFSFRNQLRVGAARLFARSVMIETVAAGGGSICGFDGERMFVGPESAGASPGPACYGAGGPLTVTDVNLLLGRMYPAAFQIPVSVQAAQRAFDQIVEQVRPESPASLLAGFLQLINERMAQAIRQISVREGYDASEYGLVAFGGAGGMHACAVAEILGQREILFPRNAGLLSAEGLSVARSEVIRERQLLMPVAEWMTAGPELIQELQAEARAELERDGILPDAVVVLERSLDLRLAGQEAVITVQVDDGDVQEAFFAQFERVFGYAPRSRPVEVALVRVRLGSTPPEIESEQFLEETMEATPTAQTETVFGEERLKASVFERDAIPAGACIAGPALIVDRFSTLVVAPGWKAVAGSAGSIRLHRVEAISTPGEVATGLDLVQRELFLRRFESVVEEMGEQLRRTALSTNIRERLDFSCALLDGEGQLLVNAPHIPVHLGALGECVRRVLEALPLRPGDVIVTNHPGFGGSHLPDVTVVSGIFVEGRRVAVVANRAHHAEVGGSRPGSMPPNARRLEEEGVVIAPAYLIEAGVPRFEAIEQLFSSARFPSRAVVENLADLHAQVASNRRGVQGMEALFGSFGAEIVTHYLKDLLSAAESAVRSRIASLEDGVYAAEDAMDDGSSIRVEVTVQGDRMRVDFSGSAPVHPGNLNATPAIVRSAVLYVLRILVGEGLPLNEGLLDSVEWVLPSGMLNPEFPADPAECPAVVGGNIETSQRIVDVLLIAFGLAANSQGTMNNVLFGDPSFGYYETIGGGAGAGPGFDGASGVHVHMTNTAITDAEILERRYPIRIRRFGLRPGSGGEGTWRGGDGLIREFEFLRPIALSILAQRRQHSPNGLNGGQPGQPGRQTRIHPDGTEAPLTGTTSWDTQTGERLRIETPGGGGSEARRS